MTDRSIPAAPRPSGLRGEDGGSRPFTGIARTTSNATPARKAPRMPLGPGMDLTLRPMRYPPFFEVSKGATKNTWTVEEVDSSTDLAGLGRRVGPAEKHLVRRLVAFFATGDSIVHKLPGAEPLRLPSPDARTGPFTIARTHRFPGGEIMSFIFRSPDPTMRLRRWRHVSSDS